LQKKINNKKLKINAIMKNKLLIVSLLMSFVVFSSMTGTKTKPQKPTSPISSNLSIFLKLDGISGGSVNSIHAEEFEVNAMNFGVSNNLYQGSSTTQLESSNKPNGSDISLVLDEATLSASLPSLFLKVCNGQHILDATISINVPRSGGLQEIENIKLNDVIITSIISSGDDSVNGTTQTTISLNFKSIERKMYAYNSQTGVWTAGTPVIWNYADNNQTP
jgi:type VI protein secretion system component Hcp